MGILFFCCLLHNTISPTFWWQFKYTHIIFVGCSLRIVTVMTNGVLERGIQLSELESLVRKDARLTAFVYGKKSLSNI